MSDRLAVLLYGEALGALDQFPTGQRVFRYADGLVGTTTPVDPGRTGHGAPRRPH